MGLDKYQIRPVFARENTLSIVMAPDNNYVKYFSVALQSIIETSQSDLFYDIVVFEADISSRNKEILIRMLPPNFSLRFYDVRSAIYEILTGIDFCAKSYWSIASYYRLLIPIVMRDYERVLYLDSDIVVKHGLNEFYCQDFQGQQVSVVRDSISLILSPHKASRRAKILSNDLGLLEPEKYFNSGVMLFNVSSIDCDSYIRALFKAATLENIKFPDQDILNVVFQGKSLLSPMKYNTPIGCCKLNSDFESKISKKFKDDFEDAKSAPVVLHFTGPSKPWNKPEEAFSDVFWYFARKSPFYEEILYANRVPDGLLKDINSRFKIYVKYWVYSFLGKYAASGKRDYFMKKQHLYKKKIMTLRKYL